MNGFVVLDKAEGITSFKASSFLRKVYNERKTGHTGTLDPMATGVLPVAFGRATRFIDYLPSDTKAYTARMRFGITTDTLDITGTVLNERPSSVTLPELEAVLPAFRGEILQLPPMYSALSVNGHRLYELARKGIEVEREQRKITVTKLEISSAQPDGEFEIRVECSKGTYIRSLIADIGEALGCGAVMTALRRTASNGFCIENAFTEEQIKAEPEKALLPIDAPFGCYKALMVSPAQSVRFTNGGDLDSDRVKGCKEEGVYRVYSPEKKFLGLGEVLSDDPAILKAKKVMGNE